MERHNIKVIQMQQEDEMAHMADTHACLGILSPASHIVEVRECCVIRLVGRLRIPDSGLYVFKITLLR